MNHSSNFNELLLNMLNNKTCELNNQSICLITNETLIDDHITLFCNHSFNYNAIFKEIKKQKEYNSLETHKLKSYQIKCPYCRNIQNKLLPYNNKYSKVFGVNHPLEHTMFVKKCIYMFKSGKRKNQLCDKLSPIDFCQVHSKIMKNRKKTELEKINKLKMELIEKENSKLAATTDISNIKLLNTNNCFHFLLNGKNKGEQCGRKKCKNDTHCSYHKRYYKKKLVVEKQGNTIIKSNIKLNKKINI